MYLNVQSKQDLNSHRKLMGKNILFAYLKKIIKKNIYCTCMIWKLSFSNRLVQMIYFWFHKTQNTLVLTFYKFEALFQKCGYYSRESLIWGNPLCLFTNNTVCFWSKIRLKIHLILYPSLGKLDKPYVTKHSAKIQKLLFPDKFRLVRTSGTTKLGTGADLPQDIL